MMTDVEKDLERHQEMKRRMVAVARRMLETKRELQEEIRNDMNNPEIRAAIDELKRRQKERNG